MIDLPSFGSFAFDAMLTIIAFAGWKHAWDLEKEINAQASTWEATAMALKKELHSRSRAAFTLIEMLIVVTIMMIMVAAAATMMKPASDARRIRESARALNVYLGSARNRAMETGRPCGVMLHRFNNTAAVMVAYQCEVPPCYAGDTQQSCAQIVATGLGTANVYLHDGQPSLSQYPDPATLPIGDSLPQRIIRIGDTIQFGYQGVVYTIVSSNGTTDTDGYLMPDATVLQVRHPTPEQPMPWDTVFYRDVPRTPTPDNPNPFVRVYVSTVPYRIYRAPVKGGATPLQLPAASVVDLKFSGTDAATFGSTGDVTILFSPSGSLQAFYYGSGIKLEATDAVYLLVGKNEKVANASGTTDATMNNMQDVNNMWVVVTPQNGSMTTANVSVKTATEDERSLARMGIAIGGK